MRAHQKWIGLVVITLCAACGGGGSLPPGPVGGSSPPGPPPTVSLVSPASGQTVSGVLNYAATVNSSVTKVEFSVSSASPMSLGTSTAAPFGGSLDTIRLENGAHTLTA